MFLTLKTFQNKPEFKNLFSSEDPRGLRIEKKKNKVTTLLWALKVSVTPGYS